MRTAALLSLLILLYFTPVCGERLQSNAMPASQSPSEVGALEWEITRKAPYLLYTGNPDEMKLVWQLDTTATSTLRWGEDTAYSNETTTTGYGQDHQHQYRFTGLEPSTKYYYQVTAASDTHRGSFRSAPENTVRDLQFLVYGDTRSYPHNHNRVANAVLQTLDAHPNYQTFILHSGDLVGAGSDEESWTEEFFNPSYPNIIGMLENLPIQAAMGNHEGDGVLFQKYFPYPFVKRRYWSFDYGPAHFVVLDQYTDYTPGSAQYTWLENDLAESEKAWKFILLHEPGWASIAYANNPDVQEYIQPLCEEHGVDAIFSGHMHNYSRSRVNGIWHVTAGGGGAPLYEPRPASPNLIAYEMVHHFCKVDISNDMLTLQAVDTLGNVFDSLRISRYKLIPYKTILSDSTLQPEQDSLQIRLQLMNPFAHEVRVQAVIRPNESATPDSLSLYDDGMHGDHQAGDGIWANTLSPLLQEDEYLVDIATTDLDSGHFILTEEVGRFTTEGPVRFYRYEPGAYNARFRKQSFELEVKNHGTGAAVQNVRVVISTRDSNVYQINQPEIEFGDLPPGEVTAAPNPVSFNYTAEAASARDSLSIPFQITMYSGVTAYWSDEFVFSLTGTNTDPGNYSTPEKFVLYQNTPNPFNPSTSIRYQLPKSTRVTLRVFDLMGKPVTTLVDSRQDAGPHAVRWNGLNSKGAPAGAGVYFYQLHTGEYEEVKKMVLLK